MLTTPARITQFLRNLAPIRRLLRFMHLIEKMEFTLRPHMAIDVKKGNGDVVIACTCGKIFGEEIPE